MPINPDSESLKSPARCNSRSTRSMHITASSRFLARYDRRRRRRSWRSHSWRSNEAGSIIEPAMAESARRGRVSWHGKRLAPKKPPERWPIHGDESKRGNECGKRIGTPAVSCPLFAHVGYATFRGLLTIERGKTGIGVGGGPEGRSHAHWGVRCRRSPALRKRGRQNGRLRGRVEPF